MIYTHTKIIRIQSCIYIYMPKDCLFRHTLMVRGDGVLHWIPRQPTRLNSEQARRVI